MLIALLVARGALAHQPLPRTIIALWDGDAGPAFQSEIHQHAEMVLNHLGLVVEYHDLNAPLPAIVDRADVRGVFVWMRYPTFVDSDAWLDWLAQALAAGKRFVSFGHLLGLRDGAGRYLPLGRLNAVFRQAGFMLDDTTEVIDAGLVVATANAAHIGFERPLRAPLPFVVPTRAAPPADAWLTLRAGDAVEAAIDAVVVGPHGGYVAHDYALYFGATVTQRQWLIDPFAYFRAAFATDDLPKPDVTTVSGRRIYYSHIDGDGWRNVSLVDEYASKGVLSARVILEEALRPYPDLPVTVAPISAELDRRWYGTNATRQLAREMFALPQVELGSHTHTHPFAWGFFRDYTPAKEQRFLARYAQMHGDRTRDWVALGDGAIHDEEAADVEFTADFVPRAYAVEPFDLALEITGSKRIIEALAPPGKTVRVMQWSGDTSPFEAVLAATAAAGMQNINGGDSRFDTDYPSYAFVAPVGREVGRERQVYATNSNENTYTDLWRGRYYAFRFLAETLERTEAPRRVRAANVYYHIYSGERLAALRALLMNLEWARAHELAPLETSRYAAIAQGFFTTALIPDGPRRWRVLHRGALATLRFDDAAAAAVDWTRSRGVLGQRHHQGSLYVALDPLVEEPVVALADADSAATAPLHLVHSRWLVGGYAGDADSARVSARGYGAGEMCWQGQPGRRYRVSATTVGGAREAFVVTADNAGRIEFALALDGLSLAPLAPGRPAPVSLSIVEEGADDAD
ncbi:MAG: hypothetical protein RLW42_15515 [Gammaproteobacteria bacterium]